MAFPNKVCLRRSACVPAPSPLLQLTHSSLCGLVHIITVTFPSTTRASISPSHCDCWWSFFSGFSQFTTVHSFCWHFSPLLLVTWLKMNDKTSQTYLKNKTKRRWGLICQGYEQLYFFSERLYYSLIVSPHCITNSLYNLIHFFPQQNSTNKSAESYLIICQN